MQGVRGGGRFGCEFAWSHRAGEEARVPDTLSFKQYTTPQVDQLIRATTKDSLSFAIDAVSRVCLFLLCFSLRSDKLLGDPTLASAGQLDHNSVQIPRTERREDLDCATTRRAVCDRASGIGRITWAKDQHRDEVRTFPRSYSHVRETDLLSRRDSGSQRPSLAIGQNGKESSTTCVLRPPVPDLGPHFSIANPFS